MYPGNFILCFSLAIFFLSSHQSIAQRSRSYYVSISGNDENDGTKSKPFQTIQKINGLHLIPGDTVFLKADETFNSKSFIISSALGTKKKPVVITSYGNGHAIVNA